MKKKFLPALLAVFLAAGCQAITPSISNRPSMSPSGDQTIYGTSPQVQFNVSGWRIYSDSFISFKYPQDWKVERGTTDNGTITELTVTDTKKTYFSEGGPIAIININYEKDRYNGSITSAITNKTLQQSITSIMVDNHQAYRVDNSNVSPTQHFVVVFTNGLQFNFNSFEVLAGNDQGRIRKVFDTILSTVHFQT